MTKEKHPWRKIVQMMSMMMKHLQMKDRECHASSTEYATHLNKSCKVRGIIYSGLEAQLKEGSVIL